MLSFSKDDWRQKVDVKNPARKEPWALAAEGVSIGLELSGTALTTHHDYDHPPHPLYSQKCPQLENTTTAVRIKY